MRGGEQDERIRQNDILQTAKQMTFPWALFNYICF